MQYPGTISHIKERAANIRLTMRKLAEAQVAEELRLRDYLNALHPVSAPEMEKAS
jgi:hypothetical protein